MRTGHSLVLTAAALALSLGLSGCSGSGNAAPSPKFSPRPIVVITTPPSTSGPYVVVAVDNHFHDIHPSDPPSIARDRPFVVKNEGDNLHNFTVAGSDISVDIAPGHALRWSRIGAHLKPGFYTIFCKYHTFVGMTGSLYVIE